MVFDDDQLHSLLRSFIQTYCYKNLTKIIKKGEQSLIVNFSNLSKFNKDLAEELLENPEPILKSFEIAIKDEEIVEDQKISVRFVNLPKSSNVKIRNIRHKHIGKLIWTDGIIRQSSDVRPKMTSAVFECSCGNKITVIQKENKLEKPPRCPSCRKKDKFILVDKELVDMQRLVIEESPESLVGADQPKRISVFLVGDILKPSLEKNRYPGNKIKIVGILKEVPVPLRTGGESTKFDLIINANSVETIEEEFDEIEISKEEEEEIKALSKDPKIYKKLVASVAPSIYGYNDIKEAIVLQLFGGAKKERADGTRMRGDIHIFLIGDPGAGKSELLKYIAQLAPKSKYVSGKGATGAGLTATVVKDEFMRGWALEAGTLVLTNNGICCIDELDKMTPEDRSAMHEALEQQKITISKANVQATLRAETTVLAAANPKYGRFDPYQPIAKQIDLPNTLINRFDLIFIIKDEPDKDKDREIAKHVLTLQRDIESIQPEIDTGLMRKYIAYARQTCFPKLSKEAQREITKFYVDLRSSTSAATSEGVKSVPISARQLQALVRLSEASARIRLDNTATASDARKAIRLLKNYLKEVGTDPETGQLDIDRIATGVTATQRDRMGKIIRILDNLENKFGNEIPEEDILVEAENEGIEKQKAKEILQNMLKKGELFEPRHGIISRM